MINQVFLSGNVCGEPEVKTFDNGGAIATFSLATTEKGYTTKSGQQVPDRTDFHRIVLKNMGGVVPYIHKGDKLNVVGKLTYRKYNDQSGAERQITEIIGQQVDLCTKQPQQGAQQPQQGGAYQQPTAYQAQPTYQQPPQQPYYQQPQAAYSAQQQQPSYQQQTGEPPF